jgi:hypothetical protein
MQKASKYVWKIDIIVKVDRFNIQMKNFNTSLIIDGHVDQKLYEYIQKSSITD